MKSMAALCLLLVTAGFARGQSASNATQVAARTTLHNDNTRTDSVKDLLKHQLTETTYNARGVVIAKKTFLLGENGDPTQGVIYDGADNIIARVQFIPDDLGRIIEERLTNNQGEIFQRVLRKYDANGKAGSPQVINLPVKASNMRPSKIDYDQSPRSPSQRGPKAQTQTVPPGVRPAQTPQVESVSPQSGAINTTPAGDPAIPPNLQIPPSSAQTAPQKEEEPKKKSKLNPFNWFKKEK